MSTPRISLSALAWRRRSTTLRMVVKSGSPKKEKSAGFSTTGRERSISATCGRADFAFLTDFIFSISSAGVGNEDDEEDDATEAAAEGLEVAPAVRTGAVV